MEVADAYPLVVVESDTARVSGLQLAKSDTARVSVLSVAGCKFSAIFFGEGRLGCGRSGSWPAVSLSGLGGNLADFDRRASPVGSCSSGRTPVDNSENGVPVRELIGSGDFRRSSW